MAEPSEARKRADARKAKILARGNAGLAKLATTARGEEGSTLYDTSTPSTRPSTPSIPTPTQTASTSTSNPHATSQSQSQSQGQGQSQSHLPQQPKKTTTSFANASKDPSEEYQRQMEEMMKMLGGGGSSSTGGNPFGGGPGGSGSGNPFAGPGMDGMGMGDPAMMQQMMAQMMGGLGGGGGGGGNPFAALLGGSGPGGPGLLTDSMDPTSELNDPSTGLPLGLNPFGSNTNTNTNTGEFINPFAPPQSPQKTLLQRIFPIIHLVALSIFWVLVFKYWEPSVRKTLPPSKGVFGRGRYSMMLTGDRERWAFLGGETLGGLAREGSLAALPVFWAFTTLELILQTTRFMILKSPPPPPSLISQFLPLLPPKISYPIITLSRYFFLLNQVWKDGCFLLFCYGLTILWGVGGNEDLKGCGHGHAH